MGHLPGGSASGCAPTARHGAALRGHRSARALPELLGPFFYYFSAVSSPGAAGGSRALIATGSAGQRSGLGECRTGSGAERRGAAPWRGFSADGCFLFTEGLRGGSHERRVPGRTAVQPRFGVRGRRRGFALIAGRGRAAPSPPPPLQPRGTAGRNGAAGAPGAVPPLGSGGAGRGRARRADSWPPPVPPWPLPPGRGAAGGRSPSQRRYRAVRGGAPGAAAVPFPLRPFRPASLGLAAPLPGWGLLAWGVGGALLPVLRVPLSGPFAPPAPRGAAAFRPPPAPCGALCCAAADYEWPRGAARGRAGGGGGVA